MKASHLGALALATLLGGAAPALAQAGFDDLWAQWQGTNNQLAASEAQMMQQLMNDPRIQAGYQQHLSQGGQMSFQQYAYYHGATAGFTPQGAQQFQQSQGRIASDNAAAYQTYMNGWYERSQLPTSDRTAEAGRVMQGTRKWQDPATGRCWAVAYIEAGVPYQGEIACDQ